jgi:hypothetical protein
MLNYVYHVAFDATGETKNTIFADGKAVVEGDFVGKHIGEFGASQLRTRTSAWHCAWFMTLKMI